MYNKLFTKILDSSIWLEPTPTRIVWVTMIAAMDEDGFCSFASPKNVANRALVTLEEAQNALQTLEAPDPNSSDPDNEGRRLERVDGGWVVLNAGKYRAMATREVIRERTKERVRKHREKKRCASDEQIKEQGDCLCCGEPFQTPFSLYVALDHNHDTGEVRGLVCTSCNTVIGRIEKGKSNSSPKTQMAIAYLMKRGGNSVFVTNAKCNASVTQSEQSKAVADQKQIRDTHERVESADAVTVLDPPVSIAPRRPYRGRPSLLGGVHPSCHSGTWGACARGMCIPAFLVSQWKLQLGNGPDVTDQLRSFVDTTLSAYPEGTPFGDDPLKFWRGKWAERHGTKLQGDTKASRTMNAAREALAMLEARKS